MNTRVVIVLGAAVWPGGRCSPTLARRVDAGVALWRAGEADRIVIAGGLGTHPPSEAEAGAAHAEAAGVPTAQLLREGKSRNTIENIAFSIPLLPSNASVTLVSDWYHLPRAWLCARRLGLHPRLRPAPAPRDLRACLRQLRALLREIAALPHSALRPLPTAKAAPLSQDDLLSPSRKQQSTPAASHDHRNAR